MILNSLVEDSFERSLEPILQFTGEYRWLSNFFPCSITLDGEVYPSTEHAYMSAKSDDPKWKFYCSLEKKAGKVKEASYKIQLVPDWDLKKISVMSKVLRQKFFYEPFRSMLLQTRDRHLEEGNNHGDTFWGVSLDTGEGENMLGRMIMAIRDELLAEETGQNP